MTAKPITVAWCESDVANQVSVMALLLLVDWSLAIPSYHTGAAPFQHNVKRQPLVMCLLEFEPLCESPYMPMLLVILNSIAKTECAGTRALLVALDR
jgi:hypothetical protein